MQYNHRKAVIAAEDLVLDIGKLLDRGDLSALIHPAHSKPTDRWRDAGFVILRNESEEVEADEKHHKVFTPLALEVSGFMHRITDGAMKSVLENTDHTTFFGPAYKILADQMAKPRGKGPAKGKEGQTWEPDAMRAIVSLALSWLKKVKQKPQRQDAEGLVEERPTSFEEYIRRKAERGSGTKKDIDAAAAELSKSMEELAAGVKGLAESGAHEFKPIAGIPGYLTPKAWFPNLNPFMRITEEQLEKVQKALIRMKVDPAPAMSQLYGVYLVQCGHLGVDSTDSAGKVKPRRKS
jgi:hypothetical protein